MKKITITRPDDWHVHFRDDLMLQHTVPATAQHFSRALVMPNLLPPITDLSSLQAYREKIIKYSPNALFKPYFTFYLNANLSINTLNTLHTLNKPNTAHQYILGAKWYPKGVTTNSDMGVESIRQYYPILEAMQEYQLVLQIHGETPIGDIFEREPQFIQQTLRTIIQDFPKLPIVLEHISTKQSVAFITDTPPHIAATITPHHLFYNRNDLLAGGIKPHFYCLPILKHESDQKAIQQAAISGNPKFFAGTDSAPHIQALKESACGCAGIYSAPYAIALYAHLFNKLNALDKLDNFMGRFGAEFYKLPLNQDKIELIQRPQIIPERLPLGDAFVVPMHAGKTIDWSINDN